MEVKVKDCPNCGGSDLRITMADAIGDMGPDLLPGVGGLFRRSRFAVVVCCNCGLTRFFVPQEELENVKASWRPLQG